jgi:polyisoprenoid-binding protein YceI
MGSQTASYERTGSYFFSFLFFSVLVFGQNYTPVDEGSKVHFVIDNFGIATGGDFKGLTGTIKFDPAQPTAVSLM